MSEVALRGIFRKKNDLSSLSKCKNKSPIYEIACYLAVESSLSNRLDYNSALVVIKRLNERMEKIEIPKTLKEELINKEKTLELASIQIYRHEATLKTSSFEKKLIINEKNLLFTLDTGAQFSSIIAEESFDEEILVSSFSGVKANRNAVNLDTQDVKKLLFFENKNFNLLGLNYLKNFKKVHFSKSDSFTSKVSLYEDNTNIFTVGELKIKNNHFEKLNFCIDTGSSKTTLTPKTYKLIKKDILDSDLIKMKIKEPNSTSTVLAKLINNAEVIINERIINLIDIPVIVRGSVSTGCNLIFGRDILDNILVSIDFNESTIYLNIK